MKIGVRYLPDDAHPQPSDAEVVRINEQEDGQYSVGVRLSPAQG